MLIFIGDGLFLGLARVNAGTLMRAPTKAVGNKYRLLKPILIRNARIRIEDHVGEILRPHLICIIIGEEPGLATTENLSAYIIYRPRLSSLEADRTVISNLHAKWDSDSRCREKDRRPDR